MTKRRDNMPMKYYAALLLLCFEAFSSLGYTLSKTKLHSQCSTKSFLTFTSYHPIKRPCLKVNLMTQDDCSDESKEKLPMVTLNRQKRVSSLPKNVDYTTSNFEINHNDQIISRRNAIQEIVAITIAGPAIFSSVSQLLLPQPCDAVIDDKTANPLMQYPLKEPLNQNRTIDPIDLELVIRENKVNVTVSLGDKSQIYIDKTKYEKMLQPKFPSWLPPIFYPRPKSLGQLSDLDLLLAGTIAGAFTEIIRSILLYPISTIKTRIQFRPPEQAPKSLTEKTVSFVQAIQNQTSYTNLYAGVVPSLIATVPSAGFYFGVRDVAKRELLKLNTWDDLTCTLFSVFLGDVFCLAIKTPVLAFSIRRQVATIDEEEEEFHSDDNDNDINVDYGKVKHNIIDASNYFIIQQDHDINNESRDLSNSDKIILSSKNHVNNTLHHSQISMWNKLFKDSWKQLPLIIITDVPYLLLKVSLIRLLAHGNESVAEYTLLNTVVSCFCAALTTPFDVVRTRLLIDSDGDPTNGFDGGLLKNDSSPNILEAMILIMKEGEGSNADEICVRQYNLRGVQNLFSGWYERILYLGLGIAWFDSICILGYIGVRDTILLDFF